ncbi:hypothetical protein [Streptomyces sp. NPDC005407]|uniref:hypothetical protein n=1 Tax=Streptomyces sp. NPDC005407 TaxID=3155340 RepID=UPI0033AD40D9
MAPRITELTERRRTALCDWVTANNVRPKDVPQNSDFSITTSDDGQRTIHYTAYVRDEATDNILVDPDDRHRAWREQRSTPCLVEPPAWLRIPGARTKP